LAKTSTTTSELFAEDTSPHSVGLESTALDDIVGFGEWHLRGNLIACMTLQE
jgi:hypothetical protein